MQLVCGVVGGVVGGELGLELVGRNLSRDVARGVVAVRRIPMPTRSGGARLWLTISLSTPSCSLMKLCKTAKDSVKSAAPLMRLCEATYGWVKFDKSPYDVV